jgi:hypothetical protein
MGLYKDLHKAKLLNFLSKHFTLSKALKLLSLTIQTKLGSVENVRAKLQRNKMSASKIFSKLLVKSRSLSKRKGGKSLF